MFWSIGDGPRNVGRVELAADQLSLSPTTRGAGMDVTRFRDLVRVLLERGTLRVERRTQPPLTIGSLDTPGALRELAERLSAALG